MCWNMHTVDTNQAVTVHNNKATTCITTTTVSRYQQYIEFLDNKMLPQKNTKIYTHVSTYGTTSKYNERLIKQNSTDHMPTTYCTNVA